MKCNVEWSRNQQSRSLLVHWGGMPTATQLSNTSVYWHLGDAQCTIYWQEMHIAQCIAQCPTPVYIGRRCTMHIAQWLVYLARDTHCTLHNELSHQILSNPDGLRFELRQGTSSTSQSSYKFWCCHLTLFLVMPCFIFLPTTQIERQHPNHDDDEHEKRIFVSPHRHLPLPSQIPMLCPLLHYGNASPAIP